MEALLCPFAIVGAVAAIVAALATAVESPDVVEHPVKGVEGCSKVGIIVGLICCIGLILVVASIGGAIGGGGGGGDTSGGTSNWQQPESNVPNSMPDPFMFLGF